MFFMGVQAGQKFEYNDKHIYIQNQLRESRTGSFTGLPPPSIITASYPGKIFSEPCIKEKSRIAAITQEREKQP